VIDTAGLIAASEAQGMPVGHVAYLMTSPAGWWLGRVAWIEQRWFEVGRLVGADMTPELRPFFREQFYDACAAAVRKHYGMD
jgi:hypothetical protein